MTETLHRHTTWQSRKAENSTHNQHFLHKPNLSNLTDQLTTRSSANIQCSFLARLSNVSAPDMHRHITPELINKLGYQITICLVQDHMLQSTCGSDTIRIAFNLALAHSRAHGNTNSGDEFPKQRTSGVPTLSSI